MIFLYFGLKSIITHMKNLLFISFFICTINSSAQTVNGNGVAVKQTMNVLVEDKSVEAVNAYWSQKNYSDAMNRINEARYERISNWVDKPFSFSSDISNYKYITRNLIKRM